MNATAQRGFSLVAAIFLIVIIALVAAFMVTIGSVQRTTSAYSVVGARNYVAASSAVEWAVHHVLSGPACFPSPTTFPLDSSSGTFQITLTCAATPVTEGAIDYIVFDIMATAEYGTSGQDDYFSRTLAASVSSAP